MWRFLKSLVVVVIVGFGISEDVSAQEKNELVFDITFGLTTEDSAKYAPLAAKAFRLLDGAQSWDVDLKTGEVAAGSVSLIINTLGGFHFPKMDTVKLGSSYRYINNRVHILATAAYAKRTRDAYQVWLHFRDGEDPEFEAVLWQKSEDPPFIGFVVHSFDSERQLIDVSSEIMRQIDLEYSIRIVDTVGDTALVGADSLHVHNFFDSDYRIKYSMLFSVTSSETRAWDLEDFVHRYFAELPHRLGQKENYPKLTSVRGVFDIWGMNTFLRDFLVIIVYDGAQLETEDFEKIVAGGSQ